jgi:hypothetical protein
MENNKQSGSTIKQKDGLAVKIKQKRYQVTEKQLLAIMENKLEAILTESTTFDSDEQKKAEQIKIAAKNKSLSRALKASNKSKI